jgi:hypothetical protein
MPLSALLQPGTHETRLHTHTPWASFTFSDASHASCNQIPFADLGRAWSRFGHDALAIPAPYLHGENQTYIERKICAFARVQACTMRINCHRKISALMWRSSSSSMQRSASWSNVASTVTKSAMPIFGGIRTCIVVARKRAREGGERVRARWGKRAGERKIARARKREREKST